jgi:hypothetical protein
VFGLLCAAPASIVALDDVPKALGFAFGVLPAVILGISPHRSGRIAIVVAGTIMGTSIFVGSVVGQVAAIAVVAIFVAAIGASVLAQRRARLGQVVLTIGVPLVAIGFSFHDERSTAAGLAVLLVLGSGFGWLVSQLWPEGAPSSVPRPPASGSSLLGYGIRLGAAGGIAAAVGFAAGWDHVGWAPAACMLVMRPSPDLVTARGVGRVLSVVLGALAAVALADATSAGRVYAVLIAVALVAAAGTHGSRWYITSLFTTFLALSMLVYGTEAGVGVGRFNERVAETILGVALAYLFGAAIPASLDRAALER